LIHEEDIEHHDIFIDPEHIKEAEMNHKYDLKKREKRRNVDISKVQGFMDQELDNAENAEQDQTLESKEELEAVLKNHTD
tara:strand:- start:150 stop:389 length:240 start_codon:yes stop_codon:yes gene_type:complete